MVDRRAFGIGNERRAASLLEAAGYTIVAANYRCEVGELDLVARRDDLLVFVEVRSRDDGEHGDAAETVRSDKRRRVSRVAAAYLAIEQPEFARARFDVVAITERHVEWIEDAWRLGDRA